MQTDITQGPIAPGNEERGAKVTSSPPHQVTKLLKNFTPEKYVYVSMCGCSIHSLRRRKFTSWTGKINGLGVRSEKPHTSKWEIPPLRGGGSNTLSNLSCCRFIHLEEDQVHLTRPPGRLSSTHPTSYCPPFGPIIYCSEVKPWRLSDSCFLKKPL